MALVIVIIVLLLTLAFFYLKCSIMQSIVTRWSAVIAMIIAFSYYELVADLFISRGYGLDWALFGGFLIVFIVTFAILRSGSEFLFKSNVDLGDAVKVSAALICGVLTGFIFSGTLLVAMGLLPMHGAVFYSRYDPESSVVLNAPKKPALATDGFVTGLYSAISAGSMSSDKSFGVLHADYLTQIHLNKLKTKDKILSVSSREALTMPRDKDQKPIRLQTNDDTEIMIVRAGVKTQKITAGGANDGSGISFFPAQIRLIVKKSSPTEKPMGGKATTLYPVGLWKNGNLKEYALNEVITVDNKQIKNGIYWMDIAFRAPDAKAEPTLLAFKQNAIVDLTSYEAVKNTPEIERDLDNDGQKEETP